LVFTEPWCADSLMNLPILLKMAECASNLEVRIFVRAQYPDLQKYFEDQGLKNIPLFWIMDHDFQPLGYWMERPKPAYPKIERWMQRNPEFGLIRNDASLSDEEKKIKLQPISDQFVDEMWNWYDTDLQSFTTSEVWEELKKG